MSIVERPILIVGGSGVVGKSTAQRIRSDHPNQPILIGGRDLVKAEKVAEELGNATAVAVDLTRADLGLSVEVKPSCVIIFLKDDTINCMRWAQQEGLPFISVSSGVYEIGPEIAQYMQMPFKSPVVVGSEWLVGATTIPTLYFARNFKSLHRVHIGLLFDDQDVGGPAAEADVERGAAFGQAALIVKQGRFCWISGDATASSYTSIDGIKLEASAYSPFDVCSLAANMKVNDLRIDLAFAASASRRRGNAPSAEIAIELEGVADNGANETKRYYIVHPDGQVPLTALGVALCVERLLNLDGKGAVRPGLYVPEGLIDHDYYMHRVTGIGATITPSTMATA